MRIDDILAEIKRRPLVRGNRFRVFFPFRLGTRSANILCSSVTIPRKNIFTEENRIDRNMWKKPYTYQYEDITMTFHEVNYQLRKDFDAWMNDIVDPLTYTVAWDSQYREDITIEALDIQDVASYKVKLIKAFPIAMNDLELSTENNGLLSLQITFAFDDVEELN